MGLDHGVVSPQQIYIKLGEAADTTNGAQSPWKSQVLRQQKPYEVEGQKV